MRIDWYRARKDLVVTKKASVLLYLDAFRWDYLNADQAPFLYSLIDRSIYVPRLGNVAGFTKRTAMLSGAYPSTTGHFTGFAFDPSGSPFAMSLLERHIVSMVEQAANRGIRGFGRMRGIMGSYLERAARCQLNNVPNFSKFPLVLWPWFRPTSHRGLPYEEDYDVPNLLQALARTGRKFSYWLYPVIKGGDNKILETVIKHIDADSELTLVQFSDLDRAGHRHGSSSLEYRLCAAQTDLYTRILFEEFNRAYGQLNWVIVSDHGMMDVTHRIDAGSLIHGSAARYRLRHGDHYLVFLDSTMARVWSLSSRANKFVDQVFSQSEFQSLGRIIDDELAERYHIPSNNRMYGDRIWWADPGVLVYPDYFSAKKPYVGMHGYVPDYPDMLPFMLVHGPNIEPRRVERAELIDVCPTLCDLLGIDLPPICEGRSIFSGAD